MYLKALKREKYAKFRGNLKKCTRVYDKKLLWRANLYIDERKNPDGTWVNGTEAASALLDWNNRNPWKASDGNTWDIRGDGGQIDIKPWTMYKNIVDPYFSMGGNVNNSVAYTFGGCDSVYDFNKDMEDQAIALGNNLEDSNSTLAPIIPNSENHWLNYKDTTYRPSNSYIASKDPTREYSIYEASKSGGVDCGGFLMRVASYQDNGKKAYTIGSDNDNTRDIIGNAPNIDHYPGIFPSLTNYAQAKMNTYSWEVTNMNLLIPGDIVWMDGHVSIIDKISFDDNRITNSKNITFIEATTYFLRLYVRNTIKMEKHELDGANILSCRRLIPNK